VLSTAACELVTRHACVEVKLCEAVPPKGLSRPGALACAETEKAKVDISGSSRVLDGQGMVFCAKPLKHHLSALRVHKNQYL